MRRECQERFPHHSGLAITTCITARACQDSYLAVSFEVCGGENIPGACATCSFTYLQKGLWDISPKLTWTSNTMNLFIAQSVF